MHPHPRVCTLVPCWYCCPLRSLSVPHECHTNFVEIAHSNYYYYYSAPLILIIFRFSLYFVFPYFQWCWFTDCPSLKHSVPFQTKFVHHDYTDENNPLRNRTQSNTLSHTFVSFPAHETTPEPTNLKRPTIVRVYWYDSNKYIWHYNELPVFNCSADQAVIGDS